MRLAGDQIAPNQEILVNGRRVSAPIKELDTAEGWVDIFLPLLPAANVKEYSREEILEGADQSGKGDPKAPVGFDYEIRRLKGKVKIIDLAAP